MHLHQIVSGDDVLGGDILGAVAIRVIRVQRQSAGSVGMGIVALLTVGVCDPEINIRIVGIPGEGSPQTP